MKINSAWRKLTLWNHKHFYFLRLDVTLCNSFVRGLRLKPFLTSLLLNKYARWLSALFNFLRLLSQLCCSIPWFETQNFSPRFFSFRHHFAQIYRWQNTIKTVLNIFIIAVCSCSEWLHADWFISNHFIPFACWLYDQEPVLTSLVGARAKEMTIAIWFASTHCGVK